METDACSTRSSTVEDQPVSTELTLSLFPTPVADPPRQAPNPPIDLSTVSIWCFNPQQIHQETLISQPEPEPSTALSFFPCTSIKDYLPTKNSMDLDNLAELIDAASSLSLSLSLPVKRKAQINPGPGPKKPENSSHLTIKAEEGVVKKQKTGKIPTGLSLELGNNWIHKWLSKSDVNVSSRLLLPKDEIIKYVLPLMDVERRRACQNRDGLRIKIWDLDTKTQHELSLKQWKTGSFLLTSNWSTDFVKRRSLQEGDSIWLCWDFEKQIFLFLKFNSQS